VSLSHFIQLTPQGLLDLSITLACISLRKLLNQFSLLQNYLLTVFVVLNYRDKLLVEVEAEF
jgi:hypothetical protein